MATGKISMIVREHDPMVVSFENSLRKYGYERAPGTKRIIFPFKENNGSYRTGLDEEALYIRRIPNKELREAEITRVKALRKELEDSTGIDLSPKSKYYNYASDLDVKVSGFKLTDSDSIFNLDDPHEAITFAWLRVHPAIAPSMESYLAGEVSPETQYFVNDDYVQMKTNYDKKKILNDAIVKLNALSIDKRKKIARLMDLPYSENTKEEAVYVGLNDLLHLREMPSGAYKGQTPIKIFNMLAELNSELLDVSDLVEQAFRGNIYRYKKGKVYEGEQLAFESKEELIDHLVDPKNQSDRMALETKLNVHKLKV